jgi:hypothetical protein
VGSAAADLLTLVRISSSTPTTVEGRSHIFDVIKVNMFGVRQSRLLVVEHPEPGTNVGSRLAAPPAAGGCAPAAPLPPRQR